MLLRLLICISRRSGFVDRKKCIEGFIDTYLDFPKEGIVFRDITPLLRNPSAFEQAILAMCDNISTVAPWKTTVIVAPEARGFIFGVPIAYGLGVPFVPIRKPGKLPGDIVEQTYTLEYGEATLVIPANAIKPGDQVVIVDDLLATGGTVEAMTKLIEKVGGKVVHISCLIELVELEGRKKLKDYSVSSILQF